MNNKKDSIFDEETLRHFTEPDDEHSLLGSLDQELSANPSSFMSLHLERKAKPMGDMELDWFDAEIPEAGVPKNQYVEDMMRQLVAHASNTSSPSFIGHMTSALPQFLLPLSKIMTALNQNVVKVETSDSFTPMERQVMAMMHHLTYGCEEEFYSEWVQNSGGSLGAFCSGGTVANITALWNARNLLLKPEGDFAGVAQEGIAAALRYKNYNGLAVLVSERGHYSLSKAADLLGLGRDSFVAIPTDNQNRIRTDLLEQKCQELTDAGIKVMAIIAIAGTTETGNIDPLVEIADISEKYDSYFHVDAAWGGATLMSSSNRNLLDGIERADSVTIDAHKQMYVPMGAGMVVFKDPETANAIEHHANYILRRGSKDLGRHTLEGSRPGMAMLVHACLSILGREGYGKLIDESISKAKYFAELIDEDAFFELVTEPELCLLTYRYVPPGVLDLMDRSEASVRAALNDKINELTVAIQTRQSEAGNSFVSRTCLTPERYDGRDTLVFRVVLANPLTTPDILKAVLQEQKGIALELEDSLLELIEKIEPTQQLKSV